MKYEKRHRHALSSKATGLEGYKQTWWRFLATQEVQIPLGTFPWKISHGINRNKAINKPDLQAQVPSPTSITL